MSQSPRSVLLSVFSSSAGIVFFEPPSQVIGMPDVELACLEALQDIDVIHSTIHLKSSYFYEKRSDRFGKADNLRVFLATADPNSLGKCVRISEAKFSTEKSKSSAGRLDIEPASFPKGRSSQAELLPE
jgi:hypothetical protein